MEFQTLIENRRSVRKYSSHTNVTKEQIQQLVQAALEAPSWKNTGWPAPGLPLPVS